MITATTPDWGRLWGSRPYDWASIEEQQRPTYDAAIERLGLGAGQRVLDVGCGSGVFMEMAAARGAHVAGLDASETLLALARSRVPEADLRRGDMQAMPFEHDRFDVVTGFNAFFFAADMTAALREAARVAKPGGTVLIQVFGRPERCALEAVKAALMALVPSDEAEPPPFWRPGVLSSIAADAGLTAEDSFDETWAFEFPDERAALRALLSPAGAVAAAAFAGHDAVAEAILEAIAPYRSDDGGYRLPNEWAYLVTRAS